MKRILLAFLIIAWNANYSQTNTNSKRIKSTREKLYFVNDSIQNYKLLEFDGDYGHSGFTTPEGTIHRFYQNWYNETFTHYINNKRNFSKKGLLSSETWFYKDDDEVKSYEYKYTALDSLNFIKENYDKNKFKISKISYGGNKNRQSMLTYLSDSDNFNLELFYYNSLGKVYKTEYFHNNGYSHGNYYLYNDKGQLKSIKRHIPTIWVKEKDYYHKKPDSIGTYWTSEVRHYKEDKLNKVEHFQPDDYSQNIKLDHQFTFEYDKNDNQIEKKYIPCYSDIITTISKEYDDKNRLIKEAETSSKDLFNTNYEKNYLYDEKGDLINLTIKYKNKIFDIHFTYKYDKYNNWIEQTKSVNGQKLFIWKRKITYY